WNARKPTGPRSWRISSTSSRASRSRNTIVTAVAVDQWHRDSRGDRDREQQPEPDGADVGHPVAEVGLSGGEVVDDRVAAYLVADADLVPAVVRDVRPRQEQQDRRDAVHVGEHPPQASGDGGLRQGGGD